MGYERKRIENIVHLQPGEIVNLNLDDLQSAFSAKVTSSECTVLEIKRCNFKQEYRRVITKLKELNK